LISSLYASVVSKGIWRERKLLSGFPIKLLQNETNQGYQFKSHALPNSFDLELNWRYHQNIKGVYRK
jgi:hypothetical protein